MSSAYDDVMQRIEKSSRGDDKDLAMRILVWLFRAQRTLTMDELLEALAVGAEDDSSDDNSSDDDKSDNDKSDNEGSDDDTPGDSRRKGNHDKVHDNMLPRDQVVECCKSLIQYEESSGLVRFIHYTVQEYIAKYLQHELPPAQYLAKTCLAYFALEEFDKPCTDEASMQSRVEKYKFSRYAAEFWAVHTKEVEDDETVQVAVLAFLASGNKRNYVLKIKADDSASAFIPFTDSNFGQRYSRKIKADDSFVGGQTMLHVIAKNGLALLCRFVLKGNLGPNDMYLLVMA
jgi:hypothetical protein